MSEGPDDLSRKIAFFCLFSIKNFLLYLYKSSIGNRLQKR